MRLNLRRMLPTIAMLLVAMVFGSSVADAAGPPMDTARAKLALEARGIGSATKVRQGDGAMHRGTIVSLRGADFVFRRKVDRRPRSLSPFLRSEIGAGAGDVAWDKDWSRAGHWGSGILSAACDWGGQRDAIALLEADGGP